MEYPFLRATLFLGFPVDDPEAICWEFGKGKTPPGEGTERLRPVGREGTFKPPRLRPVGGAGTFKPPNLSLGEEDGDKKTGTDPVCDPIFKPGVEVDPAEVDSVVSKEMVGGGRGILNLILPLNLS